jgi:hypothetical protein
MLATVSLVVGAAVALAAACGSDTHDDDGGAGDAGQPEAGRAGGSATAGLGGAPAAGRGGMTSIAASSGMPDPGSAGAGGEAGAQLEAGTGGTGGELVEVGGEQGAGAPSSGTGGRSPGTGGTSSAPGRGGAGGAGASQGGRGGKVGVGGRGGSSGTGGAATSYCQRLPAPAVLDCSGECVTADAVACDRFEPGAGCPIPPAVSYDLASGSPDVDDLILPPRSNDAANGCSTNCPGPSAPYEVAVDVLNETGAPVYVKLSSPGFSLSACEAKPTCWALSLSDAVGNHLRATFASPGPLAPETHWLRVEIHAAEWSDFLACDPMPL